MQIRSRILVEIGNFGVGAATELKMWKFRRRPQTTSDGKPPKAMSAEVHDPGGRRETAGTVFDSVVAVGSRGMKAPDPKRREPQGGARSMMLDVSFLASGGADTATFWAQGVQRVSFGPSLSGHSPYTSSSCNIGRHTDVEVFSSPESVIFGDAGVCAQLQLKQLKAWTIWLKPLLLERRVLKRAEEYQKIFDASSATAAAGRSNLGMKASQLFRLWEEGTIGSSSASGSSSAGGENQVGVTSNFLVCNDNSNYALCSDAKRKLWLKCSSRSFARREDPSWFASVSRETGADLFTPEPPDPNKTAANDGGMTTSAKTNLKTTQQQFVQARNGVVTQSSSRSSTPWGSGGRTPAFIGAQASGRMTGSAGGGSRKVDVTAVDSTIQLRCAHPESGILLLELRYADRVTGQSKVAGHFCTKMTDLRPGLRWIPFPGNASFRGMLAQVALT
ncbi:unnamed protein product [Amoebophrya sp. A25]|nr:unnamed protein product [Amoebophrya sp. A25]|eukprot:GSA25T00018699001.1